MTYAEVMKLDQAYYMNTFGERLPILPVRGKGSVLYDDKGVAYVDFLAGIAVNALGYDHPALTHAIATQAKALIHSSNYFYNEPQAKLAKLLCENTCADKAFFCNSGAEANEAAIKLARAYYSHRGEGRYRIISANNSFHGRTLATVTATAQEKYQRPFAPLPEGFAYVPYGDIAALRDAITPDTAAVLLEPIQGEAGVLTVGGEYFKAVRELCDKTGTLLIFDEVQTGVGRTGKLYAHQLYDVEPDIFTSAKALGGGVPIGALLAKDFCCAFMPGDHGTTFGGNPLACAAAVACLSVVLIPGFLEGVQEKGAAFKAKLQALTEGKALVTDVRGEGLMLGLQLDEALPAKQIQRGLLAKGFIVGTAGNNTLRFVPPLIIEPGQIDALMDALSQLIP